MPIATQDKATYSDALDPEAIAGALGAIEFVGCAIALVLLVVATRLHPRRRVARRVLWGIVVVFALTLAQPFGYAISERRLDEGASAASLGALPGERLDTRGWHAFEVLGVPIGAFRLAAEPSTYFYSESRYGSQMLKLRTILPPLLTNATTVCGYTDGECIDERKAAVELTRDGSTLHIRTTTPPYETAIDEPPGRAVVREFRVTPGMPSLAGIATWALLALFWVARLLGHRRKPVTADEVDAPVADDAGEAVAPADGSHENGTAQLTRTAGASSGMSTRDPQST